MEEKKKQLALDDLYVLRAGLSFISQQKDDITKIEDEALNEHAKIAQSFASGREESIYRVDRWCDTAGGWIYDKIRDKALMEKFPLLNKIEQESNANRPRFEDYDDEEESYRLSYQWEQKADLRSESIFGSWLGTDEGIKYFNDKVNQKPTYSFKHRPAHYYFCSVLAIIFTVIFAVGAGISVYMFFKLWSDYMWQPIVCALSFILCVALLVICIIKARNGFDNYYSSKLEIRYKKDDIKKIKEVIGLLPQIKQKNAEIENRKNSVLNAAKAKSTAMYKSIKKQYTGLLDERDWKYLDLIIYYFETGRADTVKEALQLVEREIQTRRIINAVEQSARYIVGAIERAVEQISDQLNVISNQLNSVIQLQQVQIGQTRQLISQTEMQNALIAKSNQTSETLMKDVAYIKNYKL